LECIYIEKVQPTQEQEQEEEEEEQVTMCYYFSCTTNSFEAKNKQNK